LFLFAAERMGARPGDCTVVEDSLSGFRAGVAAGMEVFAFCRTGPAADLATAGGRVFNDMRELPRLLEP
jgi:beta-phosphoglucomutase-like phosphatase (HAD superfamily)